MAGVEFTPELVKEYNQLFATATIRPEKSFLVDKVVDTVFKTANFSLYQKVEAKTNVPAHVVGIIHSLEASSNFKKHLHNGDPLSGKTVHVPAGRPPSGSPPFDWEVSAIDALTLKDLDAWSDWSVAGTAYVLERYNGWGYRLYHPSVKSPYLWSFSNHYKSGKYVADGVWSDDAVSQQCGGMAVLKRMVETGRVSIADPAAEVDTIGAAITPFAEAGTVLLAAPVAFPGSYLRMGSRGVEVEALQQRLLDLGITALQVADGEFGEKTEWSVKLYQARGIDAEGDPLSIDGIVGPKTWAALFGGAPVLAPATRPAAGSLAEAALAIAASQVGVREQPRGSNRGPEVDLYLDSVSSSLRGQPWCMAFVYWCFQQAASQSGVANPLLRTASVRSAWNDVQDKRAFRVVTHAESVKDPSAVEPGMIFFISTGGGHGHTGLVADVHGDRLVTIEGNTNNGGSREGFGVFTRDRRRIAQINLGFAAIL